MREGIKPPKFADNFYKIDFDADPMPALSLFTMPEAADLACCQIDICGLDCKPRSIAWSELGCLPTIQLRTALVCSIFNWSEEVEWQGVRLRDFLERVGLDTHPDGYFSIHSRDAIYFEGLPRAIARDPRVLLATGLNGQPLPLDYGGPLRLVVPFLQGYKSVKWVGAIRAVRHDPVGIKRLLAQSKTAHLGRAWRQRYDIDVAYEGKLV